MHLKEFKAAIKDYNQYLNLMPEYFEGYLKRALCRYNTKDYKNAIADFDKAISANMVSEEVYFKKGMCYFNLKNYEMAIADLDKAIALNQNNFTAKKVKETAAKKLKDINKNKEVVATLQ